MKMYEKIKRLAKNDCLNRITDQVSIMSKANGINNSIACVLVHITGAVYSSGDTIVFEVQQHIGGNMYLSVVVQCEEILEDTYTFRWDKIPEEVRYIYEYVNSKSCIQDNILFGTHIARPDDRKYAICKFGSPVIGKCSQVSEWSEMTPSFFKHFERQMKRVKNLA
jgi:hypothetical protein